MCGIFGYVGKKEPNVTKIKILGLYNQARGEDACGIFINNRVIHGNDSKKTWKKFIEGTYLETPTENFTILAHTRKASSGGTDHKFTHPYEIFTNRRQKHPKLVGVHNGTITNWSTFKTQHELEGDLNDSKTLFSVLAKKDISILKDYEGGAAFLASVPNEKNTIWVFKGASLKNNYTWSKNSTLDLPYHDSKHAEFYGNNFYKLEESTDAVDYEEERPLFMYVESLNESIYFSSLEDSLFAIGGTGENVFPVPANKLLKFKNGELVEQIEIVKPKPVVKHYSKSAYVQPAKAFGNNTPTLSIGNDTLPAGSSLNNDFDHVYYLKGKYYWGNDIIPNGIYILDVYYGKMAYDDQVNNSCEFGFYDGHMLIIPEDYKYLEKREQEIGKLSNSEISKYTLHPILKTEYDYSNFVHNGKPCTGSFTSLFSREFTLTLDNGRLINKKFQTYQNTIGKKPISISGFLYSHQDWNSEKEEMLDTTLDYNKQLVENAPFFELLKII